MYRRVCSLSIRALLFLVLSSAAVIGAAPAAQAQIVLIRVWHVCNTLPSPGCDFATIQEGIDAAADGDKVVVHDGTYYENIDFSGKDITVESISGPAATAIDGGGSGSVVSFISGETSAAVLDGFTVTNGGGNPAGFGGGIICDGATPTIRNCVVAGNSVSKEGGGIYTTGFAGPTVLDTIISNNDAQGGGGFSGGNTTFDGCEIRDNTALRGGGLRAGLVSILNSSISGNSAQGSPGCGDCIGGGLMATDNVSIVNTVIDGNYSASSGGGIYASTGNVGTYTVTLHNSTVVGNYTPGLGGGVSLDNLDLEAVNSLFWGNVGGTQPDQVYASPGQTVTISYSDVEGGAPLSTDPWPGTGNIEDNPLFLFPLAAASAPTSAGDYHIGSTSPAIDAGTGDRATWPDIPLDDIDGASRPRPRGGSWDMGADEYGGDDICVFRAGAWLFHDFLGGSQSDSLWTGTSAGCIPAPIDTDGNGLMEPSQLCGGVWHFYNEDGSYGKGIWTGGTGSDIPVPADYDGDGDQEPVLFRAGAWFAYDFATALPGWSVWTGAPPHWTGGTPVPVPMDYDGDGAADLTVYSGGPWHFFNFDGSYNKGVWTGGVAGDIPVAADYGGDGTDDIVVFRAGAWLAFDFTTGLSGWSVWTGLPAHWNGGSSLPAPLDWDGDGAVDLTVYSGGPWHFFNFDGSYNRGIWTGGVAGDTALSRRLLP